MESGQYSRGFLVIVFHNRSWFLAGGRLVDRFGPRKIMMAGAIVLSLATMASGLIREVWHLYFLCGILAGLGICGLGWVPNSVLISNWFVRNRGSMMGIAFSGMGIGILAVAPSAQYLIFNLGWRMAYLVFGLAVLLLLVPLSLFLEDQPNRSLKSIGAEQLNALPEAKDSKKQGDWTLKRVMKTLPFWALLVANFFFLWAFFP